MPQESGHQRCCFRSEMPVVNVAQCYVDVEANKTPDIKVLSKERDESPLVDSCSFHDLPPELQCRVLEQTSYADIREVKTVSKQLKRLIERNWRRAFFVLPPKIQIKILSETHMNAADMRRMKLVSKDMKYLIERGGRHLTQQDMRYCHIREVEPTIYKVTVVNRTHELDVSLEDFSRISAWCHFLIIWLRQVNLTLHLCDQVLHHFRDNKITCKKLFISEFDFNNEDKMTIVGRLLGATEASYLCIIKENCEEFRYKKEFFRLSTVRKLKGLTLNGYCDFSDDDLSATDYRCLHLERCCLSEHALRRLLEDSLEGRRSIDCYDLKLQSDIDVDRLLKDLPNIVRIEHGLWSLRNFIGENMELNIENNSFAYYKGST